MELPRNQLARQLTCANTHTHTHRVESALEWIHPRRFSGDVRSFSLYQLKTTHAKYTAYIAQLTCIREQLLSQSHAHAYKYPQLPSLRLMWAEHSDPAQLVPYVPLKV
jgi:hypothetical protein